MKLYKGYYGWTAESQLELSGDKVLVLTTMKRYSGKLVTTAQVCSIENNVISHIVYKDFNKMVMSSDCRVTEKAVRIQHEQSLDKVDDLLKEIRNYY